jgi:hypothetical protein
MDIKHIYEHISIEDPAEYQIKVKGDLQLLKKILDIYETFHVTSESTDPNHQICMITIENTNQQKLFVFINMLLRFHYPIISVVCSTIQSKKTDDRQNNNNSTIAISA